MMISPHDTFHVKHTKLERVPPSLRMAVLDRLGRGETVDVTTADDINADPFIPALTELMKTGTLDLTKNENLYYIVNRRILPITQMLDRDCYEPYRKHAATIRKLNQENNGFTDDHTLRHIAAFPPDVYQAIQEQYPDANERNLVIKWLLKTNEGRPYATVEKGI